jgi:hypothetical protein
MKFRDIPQFTRCAGYVCDHPWSMFLDTLAKYVSDYGLDMDPDFQRAHVWDDTKRVRYIEYVLRGGQSGFDIYTNDPGWNRGGKHEFVLVDGKQRVDAVVRFLRNELPIFDGHFYKDFEDKLPFTGAHFRWHVNDLATRAEVLQWYLDINSGGVVHTESELDRVRALLAAEKANPRPEDVARVAAIQYENAAREARRSRPGTAVEEGRGKRRAR